ncbi:Spc97 / Spc98 family domain containing protein [Naviculisporaceae sp. PSN 640]
MANERNHDADLFAIPDFWQPPNSLDEILTHLHQRNPLFNLDVSHLSPHPSLLPDVELARIPQGPESDVLISEDISHDGFFKLPDLLRELIIQEPNVQTAKQPEESVTSLEPVLHIPEDDVWLFTDDSPVKDAAFMTWERFTQPNTAQVQAPVFITEAGPSAFDALFYRNQISQGIESGVLADSIYCACLLNLALGRGSVLFSWDDDKKAFVKTAPHVRTSGLSLQLIQSIDKLCIDCANAIRYLQGFAQRTFSKPSTPTRVALAGVTHRLVVTVLSELGSRGRLARSILQLSSLVRPVHLVLSYFQRLVETLVRQQTEEGILTRLFEEVQSTEYRDSLLRETIAEVLRLTSKPWTDFVEEWIGLKPEDGTAITKRSTGKAFIKVADRMWIDDLGFELEEPDYFLDDEKMPSFVAADVAQTIFETGRNLRFLRDHHPENPLSRQETIASARPPKLDWQFDWHSIQNLERKAKEYRDALSLAVQRGTLPKNLDDPPPNPSDLASHQLEFFGRSDDQIAENVLASISQFDKPLEAPAAASDPLATLLRAHLHQDTVTDKSEYENFSPHWSLVPELSFGPIINAQSALINQECMKLLFSAHDLRIHIDLLRQYYLMGNGILCSRLSHALFDADLETAERKAGVALSGGVMGLRLGGGRENWPPASSELRLALMGVLSDSYLQPRGRSISAGGSKTLRRPIETVASRSYTSDLPGELSFAVRDLTPEEIEKCMDADALEALDFLQLSYKTPAPLRTVITPTVLVKYDRIFRFLLRLSRLIYIVNQQFFWGLDNNHKGNIDPSNNAFVRFRIESRHFVDQLAGYVFGIGITKPWTCFEEWLDRVEDDVNSNRMDSCVISPDRLQKRQEEALDEIMSALLLRKRQGPVLSLLEEIFGVILRFSKIMRLDSASKGAARSKKGKGKEKEYYDGETTSYEELYRLFRKKVELFIAVCKGLVEKKADKGKDVGLVKEDDYDSDKRRGRGDAENPIETLVLMLDLGGYYAKGR